MTRDCFTAPRGFGRLLAGVLGLLLAAAIPALAEPRHGIAMHGEPALPPDFVSLPQTNPGAPQGGRVTLGVAGGFDSLNPFIVKGRPAEGIIPLTFETLLGRAYDEPFTLYGLLAESVETDDARSYVEFTLREAARFADGSAVTVEDVLWSMEVLGTQGAPRYASAWKAVAKAEATGPRSVRFTFAEPNRELPLLLGLRPILKKDWWQGRDFTASGMEAPVGSGPYRIAEAVPGTGITYEKRADWWGQGLPFYAGQHNFLTIRYDYFSDGGALFLAFTAGTIDAFRETNAVKWRDAYDFPAAADGRVVKSEIPHRRPSGIEGFAMNLRRPPFDDLRVRQAMIEAFPWEFVNATLYGGMQPRIASYFSNSDLGAAIAEPAPAAERALLDPLAADLPPGALEGYALPVSDGTAANRAGIRRAGALLQEAGWTVGADGTLRNAAGEPFAFEILLVNGTDDLIAIATIYAETLQRLGINARVATVDNAQYVERTGAYDFDMTHYIRALSLSPGTEQRLYWGGAQGREPGSRNWMGIDSPAVDALIDRMLAVTTREDFVTAVRALDRVLMAERAVIPFGFADRARIAHKATLAYPADRLPLYGDFLGFMPELWWVTVP